MKSFLLMLSLLGAVGAAQASASQAGGSLALAQNLGAPSAASTMGAGTAEAESPSQKLPLAQATAEPAANPGTGFELESSLVLTLAGLLALVVVARRRVPR